MGEGEWEWPAAELTALRLGRRLGVRVPASRPHRWSFVHIVPEASGFVVAHWEFEADHLEGHDHDLQAILLRQAAAADPAELLAVLREWDLPPGLFRSSWDTVGSHGE
ncbi:hypothetical protein Q0Z83_078800 [Actinoplanes sichuanensis]|uniref:Uncharacterized protein n=1 Tax=Actinoplanes sichuanensis TaxID=512349 RepID=A0ABW4ADH3_9ACTN|nr:hypothetical protein [Actinoplanes sichuanensis]BEL09689.1 hypothetical protein Q0Z83_078800 [Actinoplanes sichuanensis]